MLPDLTFYSNDKIIFNRVIVLFRFTIPQYDVFNNNYSIIKYSILFIPLWNRLVVYFIKLKYLKE